MTKIDDFRANPSAPISSSHEHKFYAFKNGRDWERTEYTDKEGKPLYRKVDYILSLCQCMAAVKSLTRTEGDE